MTTPSTPNPAPEPDTQITTQIGLAETPIGQRLAIIITCLMPKEAATQVADAIHNIAAQMSNSGLVIAAPQVNINANGHGNAGTN